MEAMNDLPIIPAPSQVYQPNWFTLFSDFDIHLFRQGRHYQLYEKMGAHLVTDQGIAGTYFALWAPNAKKVSIIGDFNNWDKQAHPMNVRWDESGIWELMIPGVEQGSLYKYFIESHNGYTVEKADPYATRCEQAPATASVVWSLSPYLWQDREWMTERAQIHPLNKALAIYEVHPGSWRRGADNALLSFQELATQLPAYCQEMAFTHVELMPIMEHPFYGSWGYQITGYFAVTSRYGAPQDFMLLVDKLHQAGIGVILDWAPAHFPGDEHGLVYFDGTHLYEHPDTRKGFHPDWNSYIFNYSRHEVRAFLISNALYWLDKFHIDGLRVDAVASMLYLDYSRPAGGWEPNIHGGREHLEAISFIQAYNEAVHQHFPDVLTIAEESTAFPLVSHPTQGGGLGFDAKWMMGWMHDTLYYLANDPIYRSWHQGKLAFSIVYAFSERFVLPFSHDEVVYGKRSMLEKMPGDEWQQFANLRLLYAYMYGHPGAKLLFMGSEFGQRHEWRHDHALDWEEATRPANAGLAALVRKLNQLYQRQPELYELQFSPEGFEWIDFDDHQNCVIVWLRKARKPGRQFLFIAHFTPVLREHYRVGVPERGTYIEVLNTDRKEFGGMGYQNAPSIPSAPIRKHHHDHSVSLTLPPLSVLALCLERPGEHW